MALAAANDGRRQSVGSRFFRKRGRSSMHSLRAVSNTNDASPGGFLCGRKESLAARNIRYRDSRTAIKQSARS
jgi:hypothetical protein